MKVVSDKLKEVMNQNIRPATLFQASLEMTDRSVESDATVTTAEATHFSTSVFDDTHEGDYVAFEKDFFRVGSNQRILPDSDYIKNGYVSSVMCDGNGIFQEIPVIEISLTTTHSFVGMTYEFAYAYPTQIRVTYYLNGEQQGQFVSKPTGLTFVDVENRLSDFDRITFEFLSLSKPNHRLRITRISFGYEKTFDMRDILSVNHNLSIDPISSSLPYEKLTLKVNNLDKDYNPDNPQGLWAYFTNGQQLSIRYGVEVDNEIEWVDAGKLYLSDAPTVDANSASFEAVDTISTLTNEYNKGLWREDGITLYDLAVDVLNDAGVTKYILPDSLKGIITFAPLPIVPHRECLQMIANAGGCVLCTDPQGAVVIENQIHEETPIDYHIDFTKVFEKPIVKKTEKLKSVDVKVHSRHKASDISELCKQTGVSIGGVKEIQVMYDTATDIDTTVVGGELVYATYYANTAFLQISSESSVDITLSGRKITDDTSVFSTKVSDSGEVCPLDNPLITDTDRAKSVGEWVATYLESRNSYDMNFRQDFTLDINDVVYIRSDFEDNIPARITKLQFKLPGQQGAVSVRRVK